MTCKPALQKSNRTRCLQLVVLGSLLAIMCPVFGKHAKPATPASKENELKNVQEHIAKVSQSIEADAEKRDSLVGKLKEDDEGIQSAREELSDIRTRRMVIEQQLNALQTERKNTEQQIANE